MTIDRSDRAKKLAKNYKVIASSSAIIGQDNQEYLPIFVQKQSSSNTLRLLSVAEEAYADIALILDALVVQANAMAVQNHRIEQLEYELEKLRKEKVVAVVTEKMNGDLLSAAREGVTMGDYQCEITLKAESYDEHNSGLEATGTGGRDSKKASSASGEIGNLLDILKGARLAGDGASIEIERISASLVSAIKVTSHQNLETKANIRVQDLNLPKKPKAK